MHASRVPPRPPPRVVLPYRVPAERPRSGVARAVPRLPAEGHHASPSQADVASNDGCSGTAGAVEAIDAAQLFEEVIRRDRTFGPLLQDIKVAYDVFLQERGGSAPAAINLAALQEELTAESPANGVRSVPSISSAELVLDAARRSALDDESRNHMQRVLSLEQENRALRAHVKRLRVEAATVKEATSCGIEVASLAAADRASAWNTKATRHPHGFGSHKDELEEDSREFEEWRLPRKQPPVVHRPSSVPPLDLHGVWDLVADDAESDGYDYEEEEPMPLYYGNYAYAGPLDVGSPMVLANQ